jgi:hypothetical protein
MFYGSDAHAEGAAAILSLIATCRLHGVEPRQYLDELMRVSLAPSPQRLPPNRHAPPRAYQSTSGQGSEATARAAVTAESLFKCSGTAAQVVSESVFKCSGIRAAATWARSSLSVWLKSSAPLVSVWPTINNDNSGRSWSPTIDSRRAILQSHHPWMEHGRALCGVEQALDKVSLLHASTLR